jgi:hypothetical protein
MEMEYVVIKRLRSFAIIVLVVKYVFTIFKKEIVKYVMVKHIVYIINSEQDVSNVMEKIYVKIVE